MGPGDHVTYIIVGSVFIVLGILSAIWGFNEEHGYYERVSHYRDVREFMERWPPHPQPWALKLGGILAVLVGLGLLAWGIYWWLSS